MDSLTQIVLGASVGEAVLGKKVGNRAPLWGAIAGTVPDLDVIGNFFQSEYAALLTHRTFTHSLLFCIIAPPLLGWLIHRFYRRKHGSWQNWSWLSFWAFSTHILLDQSRLQFQGVRSIDLKGEANDTASMIFHLEWIVSRC